MDEGLEGPSASSFLSAANDSSYNEISRSSAVQIIRACTVAFDEPCDCNDLVVIIEPSVTYPIT